MERVITTENTNFAQAISKQGNMKWCNGLLLDLSTILFYKIEDIEYLGHDVYKVILIRTDNNAGCEKCGLLNELYEQAPKTDRNYWIWTELFVMLHGSDKCDD